MSTGPYSDAVRAILSPVTNFFDPRPPMVLLLNEQKDGSGAECPAPIAPTPLPEQFIEISFQDATTKGKITNEDMLLISEAINVELREFSVKWRTYLFQMKVYPRGEAISSGFQVYLKDNTDIEGVNGYHTKTSDTEAIAFIFVETILTSSANGILKAKTMNGVSISRIVSHEVLEMIGNPIVNQMVKGAVELEPSFQFKFVNQQYPGGVLVKKEDLKNFIFEDKYLVVNVLKEVANPVQGNIITLKIQNKEVEVSDYVYPSWFDLTDVKGPYNYKKTLTKPFTLNKGGYLDTQLVNGGGQLYIFFL